MKVINGNNIELTLNQRKFNVQTLDILFSMPVQRRSPSRSRDSSYKKYDKRKEEKISEKSTESQVQNKTYEKEG